MSDWVADELHRVVAEPHPDGDQLLTEVDHWLRRFVSYPSDHARVAHVLWIAHAWFMDCWESTPRIAFLSTEPGSGKTRALEVTEPLVPRPVHAVNVTPAYLFRRVSDQDGAPTILYDEIDTVFGPRAAKDNEDIRALLNAGHRRGAHAGRAANVGNKIITQELPAYCAVAMAGLHDLPDTIASRCVIVRMRRRRSDEKIAPFRQRVHFADAEPIKNGLQNWAADNPQVKNAWPTFPDGVEDRNADLWEPLLAVADLAGADWPRVAREAAVALVAARQERQSLGVRLLADLRVVFGNDSSLATVEILRRLNSIEDAPWAEIGGRTADGERRSLDARGLSQRLRRYSTDDYPIKPCDVRHDDRVLKGYRAADLADAWARYLPADGDREAGDPPDQPLPPVPQTSATCATSATTSVNRVALVADSHPDVADSRTDFERDVADVAHVADFPGGGDGHRPPCRKCGEPLPDWVIADGYDTHPACDLEETP